MKKLLVASAALLIAGTANAGVNISGDARVTYVGTKAYSTNTSGERSDYEDYFESRVGLNFEGKNEQGAGAKARLYFDDAGFEDPAIWNGAGNSTVTQVTVDYAYLEAPLGKGWTIKAGRVNPDYTKFFAWNIRATRLVAAYTHEGVKLIPFLGVRAASEESTSEIDQWDDNDYMEYGLVASFAMPHEWTLKAYGRYDDDQMTPAEGKKEKTGFLGDITLTNEGSKSAVIGFTAELGYKAADVQGTEDDGMGGYIMLSKTVSPKFTPALVAGMTKNAFKADNDFGFVMVGGNDFTKVMDVGAGVEADGSLLFGAFVANVAVSNDFKLAGNFLYADFDNDDAGSLDCAFEVSGVATYALSNATSLTYKIGYLSPSVNGGSDSAEDPYFGQLLRLNVAF